MNYARIYSWNPFRPNQFAYDGEGSGTGTTSSASGAGTPAAGSPPASGTPPEPAGGGATSTPSDAGGANTPSDDFSSAFDGFDSDLDEIDLPSEPSTGTEPGAAQPEPQATPPAAQTPAAAQPAPQAVPQQPAQPAAAPQAPTAPQSKRQELDEAIGGFKDGFDDLAKWAQGELFTLSPEDLDALSTDAASVIPNLMAKTYTRAVLASLNFIKNFVPDMIAQEHTRLTGVAKRTNEAETQFWSAWPQLNSKDHGEAMKSWAQAFRMQNPKATREQAIDFVGRALMTQFGIQAQAAKPQAAVRAQPFQPARPGGHAHTPPPPADPYAGMDQDFDEVG